MFPATSAADGERPILRESSLTVASTCMTRSCIPRGTCTAHPLSRKYRLSSPSMVGTAYEENAVSRAGSKRSIALMSPSVATWMRSSSGSSERR